MHIRTATLGDINPIMTIARHALKEGMMRISDAEMRGAIAKGILASGRNTIPVRVLAAEDGGQIVGFCVLAPLGGQGEFWLAATHTAHRRRGVFAQLVGVASEGLGSVFARCVPHNNAARAFFLKSGFVEVARPEGNILFGKRLSDAAPPLDRITFVDNT